MKNYVYIEKLYLCSYFQRKKEQNKRCYFISRVSRSLHRIVLYGNRIALLAQSVKK